jgi:LmbE family N-acetylglucosaminyl deacetylase
MENLHCIVLLFFASTFLSLFNPPALCMKNNYLILLFLLSTLLISANWSALSAQKPARHSAADVHQAIKKLNVLGSVLYVAAHPDDENQRFISYCANEKLYNVTYLSLTRGDGGQNLIGPEIRELLGVLRTEELLMARSIDGGKQRFTRANDFGFSKNPEETLRIWDKQEVLSDVVWTIRQTQPDVIVNRFYHDKKYDTHGHHTASAMLSVEAFDLAAKADAFPEQLTFTGTWQPRRQYFNTSWWFYGGREAFDKMDKSNLLSADLGVYLPLKGKSNTEVAAEARSMHRCQGFGSQGTRGESMEWFDFIKGDRPKTNDLFEGINTTWTRLEGGEKIGKLLAKIDHEFRDDNPSASVPDLLKAEEWIKALPDGYWKSNKLKDIREAIRDCLGLYLESTSRESSASPGKTVKIHLEAVNRSGVPVVFSGFTVTPLPGLFDTVLNKTLELNKDFTYDKTVTIPLAAKFTSPYWLQSTSTEGMYNVAQQTLRGQPETPRYAGVRWRVTVGGVALEYDTDIAYKTEEPAVGEVWRPFEILPPVFIDFEQSSYLLTNSNRDIGVRIKAGKDELRGHITLQAPEGWEVAPAELPVSIEKKGEEKTLYFTVSAKNAPLDGQFKAQVTVDDRPYIFKQVTIKYDHIPQQTVLIPATTHAARLDIQTKARNIGYYMGAGDEVPTALREMGCTVTMLEDKDLAEPRSLKKFDAIVMGVRAYNVKEGLKMNQPRLLEYVQNGGTLVVQYNTNSELVAGNLSPVNLKLSRTRVTDETAEMRFLLPDHPLLNQPNKITADDFKGWVQERGLYFPSEWDASFAAPLSCNDPGEKPADGALLVAKYGKGYYVYTGLSFFRELPAGVPGAYRLFANLISMGK